VRAALLLLFAGCMGPPVMVAGHAMYADQWLEDEKAIRQRASFEIGCNELEIVPLVTRTEAGHTWAKQVGVSGCNHRLVYVKDSVGGWILNSSDAAPK
jgi:hypothetical protein